MLPVPIISFTLSWHHDPQDHTRLRVGRMRPHLTSLPPFASDCAVSVEKERFWGDIMLGKVPLLESCVNGLMLLSILECRRKVILCSFYLLEQNKVPVSPFCDKKVPFLSLGKYWPKKVI